MKNKPEEPPRIAVKFANTVFVLGILYSVLLIVYAIYKIYNPLHPVSPVFYIISILSCGVFATLFGFGLKRLSNNLKVNLSILFFTIGITVYGFETYLEFSKKTQREIIAKQMGVPYDTRTRMEDAFWTVKKRSLLDQLTQTLSSIKTAPVILAQQLLDRQQDEF